MENIDLSYELPLICRDNVKYYKSVHDPIPTCEKRKHPISK